VQAGAIRDGFVELVDLKGWAAKEFISIDGAAPGAARVDDPAGTANGGTAGADGEPGFAAEPDGATPPDGAAKPEPKPAPGGGPLGGLIP
jgi:hypothetical protein